VLPVCLAAISTRCLRLENNGHTNQNTHLFLPLSTGLNILPKSHFIIIRCILRLIGNILDKTNKQTLILMIILLYFKQLLEVTFK